MGISGSGSACSKEEARFKAQWPIKVISGVRLGNKVQGRAQRERLKQWVPNRPSGMSDAITLSVMGNRKPTEGF